MNSILRDHNTQSKKCKQRWNFSFLTFEYFYVCVKFVKLRRGQAQPTPSLPSPWDRVTHLGSLMSQTSGFSLDTHRGRWMGDSGKYRWGCQFFEGMNKTHECYSTVTCKVLLNWSHSKLGQYCTDSLPNLGKHITRRFNSVPKFITLCTPARERAFLSFFLCATPQVAPPPSLIEKSH